MAIADPKSPDTAVRVQPGDTLSAIAKANGLTLSEIRALNPVLASDPKYNNGNTIFSNTNIRIYFLYSFYNIVSFFIFYCLMNYSSTII